jgi:hypothetical protein
MKKTCVFTAGSLLIATGSAMASSFGGPILFNDGGWSQKGLGSVQVNDPTSITVFGTPGGFTGYNHALDCGQKNGDCILVFTMDFFTTTDVSFDVPMLKLTTAGGGESLFNLGSSPTFTPQTFVANLGPSIGNPYVSFGLGIFSSGNSFDGGSAGFSNVQLIKTPAPGALALLGAAGLIGGGRRRRT